jgi:hypothetical protein
MANHLLREDMDMLYLNSKSSSAFILPWWGLSTGHCPSGDGGHGCRCNTELLEDERSLVTHDRRIELGSLQLQRQRGG